MKQKTESFYIVLLSIHGLIRGHNLELGRDADTGGQTLYVVELARALARNNSVRQVDLVTRRIVDEEVSKDYAEPVEQLEKNLRIFRIDAGPPGYIQKSSLGSSRQLRRQPCGILPF